MADPLLAEAINPRLALQNRMAAEGQAPQALSDPTLQQPQERFGRRFSPQQRMMQQQMLIQMLRQRAQAAPQPQMMQ